MGRRPHCENIKRIEFSFHLFIAVVVFIKKYCNVVHPRLVSHAIARIIYRNVIFQGVNIVEQQIYGIYNQCSYLSAVQG